MRVFPECGAERPVLRVLDHPHLPAIELRARFDAPRYGVFGDRLGAFDLFDMDRQRVVFVCLAHTSGSSNFYRIQEDL